MFCRECGTQKFKNDPPAPPLRISAADFVKNCAASLDELASSREILLAWMMAAWVGQVGLRLVVQNSAGLHTQWWQGMTGRWLIGLSFILAPLIGTYSIVRWLRQGKHGTMVGLMAWVLLAFFAAVFCLVWIVWWDRNSGEWFDFVMG